ncbi:23S rRNA (uracil(1939)-C(5))-methyltransferase RlmD [Clostridium sp. SYSU_GA19001]|uniref:23S rRNA (uracil(1939)-C(5))-methyltransferase RlmD n=1 Tax=Clostridium caldaquaticum TaxID=2940653 RepID=UPI002076FDAB|nr:23S rRNA (uracil(1939)-C(5))-methyltransferase RlmD [Clostridium caldaquaticum]MCM8710885.1 23S rRNA (uracil(1939)-C(5))-methyltransferase RlmD [Clostridium caldaquaticum]
MKKGNEYEIVIEKTEFPGYGIGILGDKKIYVKNALPGQKILGRITKKKKEYIEAKALEILEDVDYKIPQSCLHFAECGGCSHQTISYEKQLEFKKEQVLSLLKENGIDNFEFLGIEKSPEQFGYRNKMEFTFGDYEKGGELSLGMHIKGRTFGIVTVDNCQIVDEDYRKILTAVLKYFREKRLPHYRILSHEGYLRNLVIRKAKNTGEILINIVTSSQMDFDFSELTEMLRTLPYEGILVSILHSINDSLADVVQADNIEILYGRDYITEKLLGLKFKITPFSFFQTNSKGAEKLYSIVRDFMEDSQSKVVFDLYCGTGTIGQIVAPKAKKVIGVELIEEAVEAANENAKLNGLNNCKFIAGDVAKVIQNLKDKPEIIILDPPRAGVHPIALKYVVDFNAPDLIYVSCNPKSLVNDLKVLKDNGYVIQKVKLMDLFPHTPHVECVVKIEKK